MKLAAILLTLCVALNSCTAPKQTGTAQLSFHSFDGGGPSFSAELEDPDLVSVKKSVRYAKKNHAELDGAGYDVIFTFTGLKPGRTSLTVAERSPIAGNLDHLYEVTVAEDLKVTLTKLTVTDLDRLTEPTATLVLETESRLFYAAFADNDAAAAFRDRLNDGPIAVSMEDYGRFEKVGQLPWALEPCDEEITTEPGDVILYQGDRITVCYDTNTWTLTRLAKIENVTKEELLDALGEGDATVVFYLEWSE